MKYRHNNQLPNNLPQLQNLLKQDPQSYREEFLQQLQHFESTLSLFLLDPGKNNHDLESVMMFLSSVSHCYKQDLQSFPTRLTDVLKDHQSAIHPEMRMAFCRALILLRNKGLVTAIKVMEAFFVLMRIQDKKLREYLESFIISDVKNINSKHHDMKVNTLLQNFMFGMTRESNSTSARIALAILMELYRKNVWKDAKVVNVIASACLRKDVKVMVTAMQFFLGSDPDAKESDKSGSDSSDGEFDMKSAKEMLRGARVKKKSRKLKKQVLKVKQDMNKSKKKKKAPGFNYSALHLLNDPQGFAEKLFQQLEKLNERFEVKLLHLNLISRLVGIHELLLLPFYPYLQRFLQPHQREVVHLLTYAAQAMHEMVPPDVGEVLLKTIANNFVTERNSSEVMAVGLNAIRAICARCPLAISQELLSDLVEYKSHREKAVSMASRSLLGLYREKNPKLLRKKDRGKPTQSMAEVEVHEYGALRAKDYVPGAEVLLDSLNTSKANSEKDVEEGDSDSEGEDDSDEENEGESGSGNDDDEGGDVEESTLSLEESTLSLDESKSPGSASRKRKLEDSSVDLDESVAEPPPKIMKKQEAAAAVTLDRILTQKDFKKIETAQAAKKVQAKTKEDVPEWKQKMNEKKRLRKMKRAKRLRVMKAMEEGGEEVEMDEGDDEDEEESEDEDDDEDDEEESGSEEEDEEDNRMPGIVLVKDIEMIHAKKKHDRETRLASIQEGRKGREKFGKKLQRANPHASTSNQEKLKKKPFMMVRQKHKRKQTVSFRDRQVRLRNALLKQKKMIVK